MARNEIYILPECTEKSLSGNEWHFKSKLKVPSLVADKLINDLELVFQEEYLGVKKYANEFFDVNLVYSSDKIDEVCIRSTLTSNSVVARLTDILKGEQVEIFSPE